MSQPIYFYDTTSLGINTRIPTTWTLIDIGFFTRQMICIAPEYTNTAAILFSFDGGITIHGRLNPQDAMINLPVKRNRYIWIKGSAIGQDCRMWCY